jgi:hypothetical protein
LFDQSFTKASGQVSFWAYGVNNSNSTTWRKKAMIILAKGKEVLALQGLKHPNLEDKFTRE